MVAALQWPDVGLLVLSLAASATACAVAGWVTHRTLFIGLAPPLLCGAWLAFASEALGGDPMWFTVPIGLALLADVGVVRNGRRRAGGEGTPPAFVALEATGMAFLVIPSLVQMVAGDLVQALVVIPIGAGIAAWGIMSRVRRRLAVGALTIVVAVVLLLGLPLARVALQDRGGPASSGGLWLAIAAVGVVALLIAVFLEQGRQRVAHATQRLTELTAGWE